MHLQSRVRLHHEGHLDSQIDSSRQRPGGSFSGRFDLAKTRKLHSISFTLDPKESVVFYKSRGDTVREKELIARKNLAQFFQDQIGLNQERIQSLESQKVSFLSDMDQKIANAEQTVKIDSTEHGHRTELSKDGFTSDPVLKLSELKWQKSKTLLSQLNASRSATSSKIAFETRKLTLANRQLRAKAKAAETQSEVLSTVNGLLMDIRQIPHNNKTQVTFIIKRLS